MPEQLWRYFPAMLEFENAPPSFIGWSAGICRMLAGMQRVGGIHQLSNEAVGSSKSVELISAERPPKLQSHATPPDSAAACSAL
jgi:hypothetical protein